MYNDKTLTPHYQPIISVDNGMIFGYEVLGRYHENGEIKSLGNYFMDENISSEDKLKTDRIIRRKALEYFAEYLNKAKIDHSPKLFINVNPSWILNLKDSSMEFPTIQYLNELGIPGENIVIEITEHQFNSDIEVLNDMLDSYRKAGAKIAIDDFYFDNFDRLLAFRPDFVKIDKKLIRKSTENKEYKKLVTTIARFAEEVGISVLFEGVEDTEQLRNAIEAGGSYIQGFFFSKTKPEFQDATKYVNLIQTNLKKVIDLKFKDSKNVLLIESEINKLIMNLIINEEIHVFDEDDEDVYLQELIGHLPRQCIRAYICRSGGEQTSSNFTRQDAEFHQEREYKGKNWGWRPYFVFNMVRMHKSGEGILSFLYTDMRSKNDVRTFSFPLNGDYYLFLDFLDEFWSID